MSRAAWDLRVGLGFDTHRVSVDRKLYLGGVEIPAPFGLLGHSDADVLLHAVCDALLGALALGDIGDHFPDTDPAYEGVSSRTLTADVMAMVKAKGYGVANLDATVFAERPKLGLLKRQIAESVAALLDVPPEDASVKAKTGEGMDAVGRGEAVSAQAIVMLRPVRAP